MGLRHVIFSIEWHFITHLLLEQAKNLLNELNSIWLLKNIRINASWNKLLSLIVEITLIFLFSLLLSAYFRKVIHCYIELLAHHDSLMELCLCEGGAIWLLKADKCST
jgi:hypothetical protein